MKLPKNLEKAGIQELQELPPSPVQLEMQELERKRWII